MNRKFHNLTIAAALALGAVTPIAISNGAPAAVNPCVVPTFSANVTTATEYWTLVNNTGCFTISYVGNGKGEPAGTVKSVGAWAGPPNAHGEFPPAAYLGIVQPGQTLPAKSLILIGVNGFKTRAKW
jgi:hypothetical protein